MSLTAADWLDGLASFDTSSPEETRSFALSTSVLEYPPIPVGVHNGYTYFIRTSQSTVPPSRTYHIDPLDRARGLSESVFEYESVDLPGQPTIGRPDWKYGFGLGTLVHVQGTLADPTSVSPSDLVDTGFFVLLNIKDRSVWVAVDTDPPLDFTLAPTILPNDTRRQIGVMRISQPNWETTQPLGICAGDPFTKYPSLPCSLVYKRTAEKKYLDAIAS